MCFEYLWHKIEFYLIFSICSIREAFGIWNSEIKTVMVFQLPSCVWLCNPHGVQHTRLPCPSLSPGVCSNSCPSCRWYHSLSHPLSSPSPPALNLSQHQCLLASGSQSIEASASVLPMNIQGWFPLGLTALFSLQSKGLSRVFSSIIIRKHQLFGAQPSFWSNYHIHTWLLEKPKLWLFEPLLAK